MFSGRQIKTVALFYFTNNIVTDMVVHFSSSNKLFIMLRLVILALFSLFINTSSAQYDWKLEKEKNGIKVFLSSVKASDFKAVKVECTFPGTYAKLITILSNVSQFNQWVYKNKTGHLIKQNNPFDFIYYIETHLPWPMNNRDGVVHLRIKTDSLPRLLTIVGTGEPDLIPKIPGKVRMSHFKSNWKVIMLSPQLIQITYILELDPGGSIPAWLANSFADKGPYETFINLAEQLKK